MTDSERNKLFTEIFNEHKHRIFRLVSSYLRDKNQVDDLFQEVMICIWRNLHTFKGDSQITTWIYRIAVNCSIAFNRKENKNSVTFQRPDPETIADLSNSDKEAHEEQAAKVKKLLELISRLEEQDRLIIALYLESLSYKEIAEIVGISLNYVGVKINRIKVVLEKGMDKNGNE